MKIKKIVVQGSQIGIISHKGNDDFISLTDMLKAKDGEFFISDWLRNKNTVEFLGIWEKLHNPIFNYGEFAIIKSHVGLNRDEKIEREISKDILYTFMGKKVVFISIQGEYI